MQILFFDDRTYNSNYDLSMLEEFHDQSEPVNNGFRYKRNECNVEQRHTTIIADN